MLWRSRVKWSKCADIYDLEMEPVKKKFSQAFFVGGGGILHFGLNWKTFGLRLEQLKGCPVVGGGSVPTDRISMYLGGISFVAVPAVMGIFVV